ncbi:hypothetical protein ISCGN_028910 [Ixodes scapularis]
MVPTSFLLFASYAIEESPCWLLALGDIQGTERAVLSAAKVNRYPPDDVKAKMNHIKYAMLRRGNTQTNVQQASPLDLVLNSSLRFRSVTLFSSAFMTLLHLYDTNLNKTLVENRTVHITLIVARLLGSIAFLYIVHYLSRRKMICVAMLHMSVVLGFQTWLDWQKDDSILPIVTIIIKMATMKVLDLKRELKARGLSTSGNKNELLERLQATTEALTDLQPDLSIDAQQGIHSEERLDIIVAENEEEVYTEANIISLKAITSDTEEYVDCAEELSRAGTTSGVQEYQDQHHLTTRLSSDALTQATPERQITGKGWPATTCPVAGQKAKAPGNINQDSATFIEIVGDESNQEVIDCCSTLPDTPPNEAEHVSIDEIRTADCNCTLRTSLDSTQQRSQQERIENLEIQRASAASAGPSSKRKRETALGSLLKVFADMGTSRKQRRDDRMALLGRLVTAVEKSTLAQ